MSKDVEQFELDSRSDLQSVWLFAAQRGTHEYDRGHNTELDNHRLCQGVFPTIKLWVETSVSQVVDVELPVSLAGALRDIPPSVQPEYNNRHQAQRQ